MVLSCAGARGSDCVSGGSWQMDEHGERCTEVGGDDDGPPQHLKRRSQSTKSRRVFSPSMLVKKTVLETETCSPRTCVYHHCAFEM